MDRIKDNEKSLKEVVKYINSLITTINPRLNDPIPDRHLCRKPYDELHDNLQDYIELVNKL